MVLLRLDQAGVVPALNEGSAAAVPQVEALGMTGVQVLHPACDVGLSGQEQQMEMVGQLGVVVELPRVAACRPDQQPLEAIAIR